MKKAYSYNPRYTIMKFSVYIFILISGLSASAQDLHFSQFFASPLHINPANAGNFKGKYRAGINYRNQWSSFTVPWRTFDVYGDLKFNGGYKNRTVMFGAGAILMRDRAGDGNLSTTKAIAQGALHIGLGGDNEHTLSAGVGFGIVQKTLDWDKLYFNNQWDESKFNTNLPAYENYAYRSITYPDLNIGLLYQNTSMEKLNYSLNLSMHHVLNPRESFYKEFNKNNLGWRPLAMLTVSYQATDKLFLIPGASYQTQKKASELQAGMMLGYDMSSAAPERMILYAGMYNRMKDAWYPVIGLEYGSWRGFINYDVNYSELKQATNGRGAFELSLVYVGGLPRFKSLIDIPCPRF
jgi:type IX secretion system PorP/SprF family membrane protein